MFKLKKMISFMLILTCAGLMVSLHFTVITAASDDAPDAAEAAVDGQTEEDSEEIVWNLSLAGIKFTVPQEFQDAAGMVTVEESSEIVPGSGAYLTEFLYITMSEEEYDAFMDNPNTTVEEFYDFLDSLYPLGYILSIDGNRDKEDFSLYFTDIDDVIRSMYEIGKVEDHTFYYYKETYNDLSGLGEYKDEFKYFTSHPELITDNVEFSVPGSGVDNTVHFETTDINGNPVSSSDLFAENKITMINIWTTWCIYCIKEMPELENLYHDFQEQGCGIIGLLYDGNEDGAIDEAKEIIESTGVTYPVVLPWDGYEETFSVQAFPTTLFVDSQGNIIGETILGAEIDKYIAGLADALELVG